MNSGKVVFGVLAGAAVGALVGLLLTSDKINLKELTTKASDFADDLKERFSGLQEDVTDKINTATDTARDFAANGKSKLEDTGKDLKNFASKQYSPQV
ncbi:MAG: YtxH domain-containing protein [Bacteroidia bacterium]